MYNLIYRNYDKLKPKAKKNERNFAYHNQMLVQLAQIVRIDDFKDKLDLDLDVALNIKLTEGVVGITKKGDNFYLVFAIQPVGLPRKDGRAYQVNGTYIDKNQQVQTQTFTNDENIILWYNNALATPESSVDYFSYCLTETDTSIEYNLQRSRFNPYIKVKNEKQKRQYEQAMRDTHNGEPIVIVDDEQDPFVDDTSPILDVNDVKMSDKIQYLDHHWEQIVQRFSNMYGCSLNQSSKQAQMSVQEVEGMNAMSWLLCLDMLNQAKEFCERMKETYEVELIAHFGTVHEFNFKKFTNDCTNNDETMDADLCDNEEKGDNEDDNTERDLQTLPDEQQANVDGQ